MKENILICHNGNIKEDFYQIFLGGKQEREFTFVSDIREFKKYTSTKDIWGNYDAVMILCELSWENHKFSDFWGIELVQREIRFKRKINLPILFFSFYDRTQIVKNDKKKEIINTWGLGHAFIQLPLAQPCEISCFDTMSSVSELEMLDILHYCTFKGMLESIRHNLNQKNIAESKKIIEKLLLESKADSLLISDLNNRNTVNSIREFCNSSDVIETLHSQDINSPVAKRYTSTEYKVLLLDDDYSYNDLKWIEELAKEKNTTIQLCCYKNPEQALNELKNNANSYSVIICDYRLKDETGLLYCPQGYSFMKQAVKEGLYKFIAFSNMPRNFRIAVAEKLNIHIENVDKNLMLSEIGHLAFVEKIIELAEINEKEKEKKASQKKSYLNFYRHLKMHNMLEEEIIALKTKNYINIFCNAFKDSPNDLILKENQWSKFWAENKPEDIQAPFDDRELESIIDYLFRRIGNNSKKIAKIEKIDSEEEVLAYLKELLFARDYSIDSHSISQKIYPIFNRYTGGSKDAIKELIYSLTDTEKTFLMKRPIKDRKYRSVENEKDIQIFVTKMVVRRLAIFIYYWLTAHIQVLNDGDHRLKIGGAVDHILAYGFIGDQDPFGKIKRAPSCSQYLWLSPKKYISTITKLNHIAMNIEEEGFFKKDYPDLFDQWNS